jgi:LPS export ABC transporter protein LptC
VRLSLIGIGVLAVLALAYLLGREGEVPGTRTEGASQSADYGYVALDTVVVQTGDDGQPLYTLTADRVEQAPGSGTVMARKLTVRYGPDKAQAWTLVAQEAQLPGGDTTLHLQGNVQVRGRPAGSTLLAQINTQHLDYDTRTQDVRTRDDVRFTWGTHQLDARGLTANLQRGQLSLESNVHGRFLP